jgi:2,4-dienoyl-CoA reductase-like NADH-dependent reductase (Old Yellow Enzyme family)
VNDVVGDVFAPLFEPVSLGNVVLKNRIVMSPMGTRMADHDGLVNERDVAWHRRRAEGGVAMIVTGASQVHPSSVVRGSGSVLAFARNAHEGLKARAEAIKKYDCAAIGQLAHTGREAMGGTIDLPPWAPSPIPSPRDEAIPHEMTHGEIAEVIDSFAASAAVLEAAGYDGVELHGAHGYLVAQFLSPLSNARTDRFGGADIRQRMTFLLEMLHAVRSSVSSNFIVGVRLSVDDEVRGGIDAEMTGSVAAALESTGSVQYLSLTVGQRSAYVKDSSSPHGVALEGAAHVKRVCGLPLLVANRITDPAFAASAIADGRADLIGLGRALIADPDWPSKVAGGRAKTIRPCLAFVQDCRVAAGGVVCAVNPDAGREAEVVEIRPSTTLRRPSGRTLVVGSGPAGLEAARLMALSGANVMLVEAENDIGGQVLRATRAPFRDEFKLLLDYYREEFRRLPVEIVLGTAADLKFVSEIDPHLTVVATGASHRAGGLCSDSQLPIFSVFELLDGRERPIGSRVAVFDSVGFWPAFNACDYLLARGIEVIYVTPAPTIGGRIPHESAGPLLRRLRAGGVRLHVLSSVEAGRDSVRIDDGSTGTSIDVTVDALITHQPLTANTGLLASLLAASLPAHGIGDCVSPRRIGDAVLDAARLVRGLVSHDLTPPTRVSL